MGLIRAAMVGIAGATAISGAAGAAQAGVSSGTASAWPRGTAIVSYASEPELRAALAEQPAQVVRRLPALRAVEVRPRGDLIRFVDAVAQLRGIDEVEPRVDRRSHDEPALAIASVTGAPQWQFTATRSDQVPDAVLRAAQSVTIAVIDTGADLTAPDLAAKQPLAYSIRKRSADVTDRNGHGTFVSSLAAGSGLERRGHRRQRRRRAPDRGAGRSRGRLLQRRRGGRRDRLGGRSRSPRDQPQPRRPRDLHGRAAGGRVCGLPGALLVAAVGNERLEGNPVEYPAALLQPPGSRGAGGAGLAVTASTRLGGHADFSNTGTHVSLAAPGETVFGAVSGASETGRFPRVALPGSLAGIYGYGSGTSYAAPQVSGAAALVWAANAELTAAEVATILEQTASGGGRWNPLLGYGVLDVAAAVARASGIAESGLRVQGSPVRSRVALSWSSRLPATAFRVTASRNGGDERVLTPATTQTAVTYALAPGSAYSFTVSALDADGAPLGASSPWTVSLAPARASLVLAASGGRQTERSSSPRRSASTGSRRRPDRGGSCSSPSSAATGPASRARRPTATAVPSGACGSPPARTACAFASQAPRIWLRSRAARSYSGFASDSPVGERGREAASLGVFARSESACADSDLAPASYASTRSIWAPSARRRSSIRS